MTQGADAGRAAPAAKGRADRAWLDGLLAAAAVLLLAWGLERAVDARLQPDLQRVGPLADRHHIEMGAIYGGYARESLESGTLRMHDSQTAEPHPGTLLRPWEWALGQGLRLAGLGAQRALAVERLFAVLLAGVTGSLLLALCTASRVRRRLGLAALVLGGNLYWLIELLGRRSSLGAAARGWLDETFPRLSGQGFSPAAVHLGVPHLALELGCFALVVVLGVRAARRESLPWSAAAGLAAAALACVRPYTLPAALAAAGAAWLPALARGDGARRLRALGALALLAAPALPYAWHVRGVLASDTPFSKLDVYHPAPPPGELVLFLGPFAAAALVLVLARSLERALGRGGAQAPRPPGGAPLVAALAGWGLVELALVHGEPRIGWEVEAALPLALLAPAVCLVVLERWPGRGATLLLAALTALSLSGTLGWGAELLQRATGSSDPLLMSTDEAAALAFLERDRAGPLSADAPSAVLLCSAELAVLAPWLAGVRAYRGHPDHVPRPRVLQERQRAILRAEAPLEAARRAGVTHLLSGPRERALGGADRERLVEYVGTPPVFESGPVAVWRLAP